MAEEPSQRVAGRFAGFGRELAPGQRENEEDLDREIRPFGLHLLASCGEASSPRCLIRVHDATRAVSPDAVLVSRTRGTVVTLSDDLMRRAAQRVWVGVVGGSDEDWSGRGSGGCLMRVAQGLREAGHRDACIFSSAGRGFGVLLEAGDDRLVDSSSQCGRERHEHHTEDSDRWATSTSEAGCGRARRPSRMCAKTVSSTFAWARSRLAR